MNVKLKRRKILLVSSVLLLFFVISYMGWMLVVRLYDEYLFELHFPPDVLSDKVHVHTDAADELAKKVRILCFVTTMHGNEDKAVAVNVTWLKRCTGRVLVTSSPLTTFHPPQQVLVLPDVPEGREHLTAKTFSALDHFYRHELNNYDWFVKADDDVFIIVENLRLMLSQLSPSDPVYLGHHFKVNLKNGYMSGGAGYVLSREALRVLGSKGLPQNGGVCQLQEPDEDLEVGRCLEVLGVQPYGTLDAYGQETFHMAPLSYTFFSYQSSSYSLHPKLAGPHCCSQLTISFHRASPKVMYTLELLLYHISVYGRHPDDLTLRRKLLKPRVEFVPQDIDNSNDDNNLLLP